MPSVVQGVDPWAVDRYPDPANPSQNRGVTADSARFLLGGLMATVAPLKAASGIIPEGADASGQPSGLLLSTVSPNAMQVQLAPGRFVVQPSAIGTPYLGGIKQTAILDVPPADPQNARIDLVVGRVYTTSQPCAVELLPGSPTLGTEPALPDGAVKLGTVPVAAGATSITSVLPYRSFAVAVGGVIPTWNGIALDRPGYPDQLRTNNGALERYDAVKSKWTVQSGRRINFTPVVRNDANAVYFLGDGSASGWYQFGAEDVCNFHISIKFGTGVARYPGQLHVDPPPGVVPVSASWPFGLGQLRATFRTQGVSGVRPQTFWSGYADARNDGLYPYFPINENLSRCDMMQNNIRDGSGGLLGYGCPKLPGPNVETVTSGAALTIDGTFQVG
jgi:hypothetical protein